jgi:hypothetical protein
VHHYVVADAGFRNELQRNLANNAPEFHPGRAQASCLLDFNDFARNGKAHSRFSLPLLYAKARYTRL